MANLIFGSSSWRMHTSQTHGSCSNVDMWRNPYMLLIPNHIFLVSSEFGWAMVHILARHSQAKIPMASLICTKTHQKGTTRYLSHPNSAVNPRISARGAYFKFSRRRGALIRRGRLIEGDAAYLTFPTSWPDMIIFLTHHMRVSNNISCLSTQKADPKV